MSEIVLAIETSQREGGVALRDATGMIHVEPIAGSRRHDDDLMPAIDRLCRRAAVRPRDLDAVAVSIGPGGFTGLRIAVSTAKVFGLSLGARIVAVPSAEVAIQAVPPSEAECGGIIVALASKRETFWVTRFRFLDDRWAAVGRGGLVDASTFSLEHVAALVADRYLPARAAERAEVAGIRRLPLRLEPAACLHAGLSRLVTGEVTTPHHLRPLYPRQPEAVTLWERRSGG
jgi:tRNA threonylcarbamoyl adenosine modification protein YeaZ